MHFSFMFSLVSKHLNDLSKWILCPARPFRELRNCFLSVFCTIQLVQGNKQIEGHLSAIRCQKGIPVSNLNCANVSFSCPFQDLDHFPLECS